MNPNSIYRENGRNYRLFLICRQFLLVSQVSLVIANLLVIALIRHDATWTIPLATSFMGGLFWCLERRVRRLIHLCYSVGRKLECGVDGYYSEAWRFAAQGSTEDKKRFAFARSLDWFYITTSLSLLVLGLSLRA